MGDSPQPSSRGHCPYCNASSYAIYTMLIIAIVTIHIIHVSLVKLFTIYIPQLAWIMWLQFFLTEVHKLLTIFLNIIYIKSKKVLSLIMRYVCT